MKIGRIICAAVMIFLCGFGWYSQVTSLLGAKTEWQAEIEAGQKLEARGLYQRAIESYESALRIQEDVELRRDTLDVCALAYEEGEISRNSYKNALEDACRAWPEEEDFWVRLLEMLRDSNSYSDAYKVLARAGRAGASGERLAALDREIRYSFTEGRKYFTRYYSAPRGYTTIFDGERWGVLSPDGEQAYECDYTYISPYSDQETALFCTEESARLIDRDNVLQAILAKAPEEAKAYSDGFLPVLRDGHWSYLRCEDSFFTGEYDDASTYQDGIAAVCRGTVWSLIDLSGNQTVEQTFSDLHLYENGNFCYDGIFAAAVSGTWNLYQKDGTALLEEFSARDMDLYLGDAVAFQDNSGLWGFADKKGTILIEPQYQQARSFSGGLAAVSDGKTWGFINRNGKLVIDYQFQDAGYFTKDGSCPISTVDGEFHMITLRFPDGV